MKVNIRRGVMAVGRVMVAMVLIMSAGNRIASYYRNQAKARAALGNTFPQPSKRLLSVIQVGFVEALIALSVIVAGWKAGQLLTWYVLCWAVSAFLARLTKDSFDNREEVFFLVAMMGAAILLMIQTQHDQKNQ